MCGLSVLAVQLHQRPFLPTGLDCREGYWTTPGYANSRIANSRTGRLASWTSRGCHRRLCVLSFRSFGGICETATPPVVQSATSPVRELTSPRVGVSASCPVTVVNVFWTISVRRLRGGGRVEHISQFVSACSFPGRGDRRVCSQIPIRVGDVNVINVSRTLTPSTATTGKQCQCQCQS